MHAGVFRYVDNFRPSIAARSKPRRAGRGSSFRGVTRRVSRCATRMLRQMSVIDVWPMYRAFSSDGSTGFLSGAPLSGVKGVEGKIAGFSESYCLWVQRVGQTLGMLNDCVYA